MINLIVVEDNTHVQERLREILRGATDMKIVGMYPDLRSAIAATPSPAPNLIVLDLKLPDVKGSEAITSLKQKFPEARITIYTAYENETDILGCMTTGAHGYILKDTPDDRLVAELHVIAQGGSTLTTPRGRKTDETTQPTQTRRFSPQQARARGFELYFAGLKVRRYRRRARHQCTHRAASH
jgi:DNA-binding NarL/FixJ family response regulator